MTPYDYSHDEQSHGKRHVSASEEFERCIEVSQRSRNTLTFCGLSAIRIFGMPEPESIIENPAPVHVCVSQQTHRTRLRGARFICWTQPHTTYPMHYGEHILEIIDPVTASLQMLRFIPKEEAVVLFDALLRRDAPHRLQTHNDLHEQLNTTRKFPGKVKGQWALRHTQEGTDSAMESRLRLKLIAARFPCPDVNHKIVHPMTGEIWFADLAYPELRIAIEYQGQAFHSTRESLVRDSRKMAALQGLAWNVVPVTNDELISASAWQRFTETLRALIRARKR